MSSSTETTTYREEVMQYTKKDGVYALLVGGYILLIASAYWIIDIAFGLHELLSDKLLMNMIFEIGFALLSVAPVFVLLRKNGQKIRSVGLHLTDWKKVLCVGLFTVAVFLMLQDGLFPGLLGGWHFNPPLIILWGIVFVLISAAREDIGFIGYIQTRIYGLVKNDILAVGVGGFIFATAHYPGLIAMNMANGGDWGSAFWGELVFATLLFIVMHAAMNAIFRVYRSIIAVTLCHFAWNFTRQGRLWEYVGEGGFGDAISGAIGFWVIIMAIFIVFPFFENRKTKK